MTTLSPDAISDLIHEDLAHLIHPQWYAPDHQAPLRQPAQCRADRSRRDDAAASLLDMSPDGSAVGVVAKRGHRKEDQLFEFTEVAHVCMLHDRLNHYVV